jgi:hypothetical protein
MVGDPVEPATATIARLRIRQFDATKIGLWGAALGVAAATTLGAFLVSWLQESPRLVAVLLVLLGTVYLLRKGLASATAPATLAEVFAVVSAGIIGYLTESWGTANGHWTYNHLPPGQLVPAWVPVAWALAAALLHHVDVRLPPRPTAVRVAGVLACGATFPLLGESICLANGVWLYHWPLKLLGVPLLALALIAYAHFTFWLMRRGLTELVRG